MYVDNWQMCQFAIHLVTDQEEEDKKVISYTKHALMDLEIILRK